ncbi:MAG: YtxH domain-containing protein [Chitinophagaceae bacterium]
MQELINKIMSEVGLSSEQASKTVSTVVEFVKSKVPGPLAANIESMFSGNKVETGAEKEEGLMDKAEDFAEAAKDKLEDLADVAKDKLGDAADKAEELAKDALGKLKGLFGGDK